MKILFVGDPHATPDAIPEMERLIDFIIKVATDSQVDYVLFAGDQYHTHSIIHLNVLSFWNRAFEKFEKAKIPVLALVGNHDKSGVKGSLDNSMMVHTKNVNVIDVPVLIENMLFIPYIHDSNEFIEVCNRFPGINTVYCHTTFDGSHYENGFYAKDGVNADLIPQKTVISGHIHAKQEFGKVWYPGAPRWRTVSDANTDRAIWVIEHRNGYVVDRVPFDTSEVCEVIYHVKDSKDNPYLPTNQKGKFTVDIYGEVDYINTRSQFFKDLGYRIRTFPNKNFNSNIKESDGLKVALQKFINDYKPKNNTNSDRLFELIKNRVKWMNV